MSKSRMGSLSVIVVTALAMFASPAAAATPAVWRVVPTPNPGAQTVSNSFFSGVSASSAGEA